MEGVATSILVGQRTWPPAGPVRICLLLFLSMARAETSMADFGGDVSQYMGLLQGTSAFSFKPGGGFGQGGGDSDDSGDDGGFDMGMGPGFGTGDVRKRSLVPQAGSGAGDDGSSAGSGGSSSSGMSEYGADYGNYLKLLEGKNALGFNPQSDPVEDNQDLQSDVFGGGMGMTGKFWAPYKGGSSYDSFGDDDQDVVEKISAGEDSDAFDTAAGPDAMEDMAGQRRQVPAAASSGKKASPQLSLQVAEDGFKSHKLLTLDALLNSLVKGGSDGSGKDIRSLGSKRLLKADADAISRLLGEAAEDGDVDAADAKTSTEVPTIRKDVEKAFSDLLAKAKSNVPDPMVISKGLSMNYKNLTLYGLSEMEVCSKKEATVSKGSSSKRWKGYVCLDTLAATLDCVTGPGVPFQGRVAAVFKQPKILVNFKDTSAAGDDEGSSSAVSIHITSIKFVEVASKKYVPWYDSSIPLNPWSKVSMSGYMVSRVKKVLPKLVDKAVLDVLHHLEDPDD